MRRLVLSMLIGVALILATLPVNAEIINIVYSSDPHYGITRSFRGNERVKSTVVNRLMILKINNMVNGTLPQDGGVGAGQKLNYIDMVVNTGDITNRMQPGVQSASESWVEFETDWYGLLDVKNKNGEKAPLYILPGNHDVSNAIGHYRNVKTDALPMAEIYNRMMNPRVPRTGDSYDYNSDRINYSFDMGGVTFMFVNMWPDSRERARIAEELETMPDGKAVMMFTHDIPDVDARHLINPNGNNDINHTHRFENLLSDTSSVVSASALPLDEHKQIKDFFARNNAIKAYFHGHKNYNEFYDFTDPSSGMVMPCFRVDSPMNGFQSSSDESLLSFMLISIDTETRVLTARECLWNVDGHNIVYGQNRSISY